MNDRFIFRLRYNFDPFRTMEWFRGMTGLYL